MSISCPICHSSTDHKMDCQNRAYVASIEAALECQYAQVDGLAREVGWLKQQSGGKWLAVSTLAYVEGLEDERDMLQAMLVKRLRWLDSTNGATAREWAEEIRALLGGI